MADTDRQTEPGELGSPPRGPAVPPDRSARDLSRFYERFTAYLAQDGLAGGLDDTAASHWDPETAEALVRAHEAADPAPADPAAGPGNSAAPGPVEVAPSEPRPIEHRLDRLAARLEQAVATALSGNAMAALGARLAGFEQRLGAAVAGLATRADVEGLKLVEAHVLELSQYVGAMQHRLDRLDAIEAQLAWLSERTAGIRDGDSLEQRLSTASGIAALAEAIAERLARRIPEPGGGSLDSVRGELLRLTERLGAVEREIGIPEARRWVDDAEGGQLDDWPNPEPLAQVYHRASRQNASGSSHLVDSEQGQYGNPEALAVNPAHPLGPGAAVNDAPHEPTTPPPLRPDDYAAAARRAAREAATRQPVPGPRGRAPSAARKGTYSGPFLAVLAVLVALGAGLTAYGVLLAGAMSAPAHVGAGAGEGIPTTGRQAVNGEFPAGPIEPSKQQSDRAAEDAEPKQRAEVHPLRRFQMVSTGSLPPSRSTPDAPPKPGPAQNLRADTRDLPHPLAPAAAGSLSLRLAASRGDPSAQFAIALRFTQVGPQRDMTQAFEWYQRAALRGFAPAQYRLAGLYERGLGVASDLARARLWYQRAAEQGHVKSMHNLGVFAARGRGGLIDYSEAAAWFGKAAERGLRDSQFNLAIFYENGLGVRQDQAQAFKWFALAARGGDRDAERRRDKVASRLAPHQLAEARALVAGWTAQPADSLINDPRAAAEAWRTRLPALG